ncbi:hypothetical protein PMAYCL1PPCAC_27121, partial [Pristionchus mayeri]
MDMLDCDETGTSVSDVGVTVDVAVGRRGNLIRNRSISDVVVIVDRWERIRKRSVSDVVVIHRLQRVNWRSTIADVVVAIIIGAAGRGAGRVLRVHRRVGDVLPVKVLPVVLVAGEIVASRVAVVVRVIEGLWNVVVAVIRVVVGAGIIRYESPSVVVAHVVDNVRRTLRSDNFAHSQGRRRHQQKTENGQLHGNNCSLLS